MNHERRKGKAVVSTFPSSLACWPLPIAAKASNQNPVKSAEDEVRFAGKKQD